MTYPMLSLVFVVGAAAVLLVSARLRRPDRLWWTATVLTLVALLVLTVVFDNVMIAADLFRFREEAMSGLYLLLAPVEDLAWPVAAALGLPPLWRLLVPREE